jgi:hypothetical protein
MKRHGLLQTLQRTPGELVDGINNTRGHARLCHQAADVCCGMQLGLRHAAATAKVLQKYIEGCSSNCGETIRRSRLVS